MFFDSTQGFPYESSSHMVYKILYVNRFFVFFFFFVPQHDDYLVNISILYSMYTWSLYIIKKCIYIVLYYKKNHEKTKLEHKWYVQSVSITNHNTNWTFLKLVSAIFDQIFIFNQMIALQKLWKMFVFLPLFFSLLALALEVVSG